MLLVQQAHHPAALSSLMPSLKHISPTHHRRNPSAPAVVQVQPSKTPGLLNLAPSRTFHPRYSTPRQHRTPKTQQQPTTALASPPHVEKERSRGRGTSDKEKVAKPARRTSNSRPGHGGRARQPSPSPLTSSEQTITSTDESLSTVVSKPISSSLSTTAPTVGADAIALSAPSGRLAAKRRNRVSVPNQSSTASPAAKQLKRSQTPPAKTKPVAVPVAVKPKANTFPISCSDPTIGNLPRTRVRRGVADIFPVCDDIDDDLERPSTPSPLNSKSDWTKFNIADGRGPLTAPIRAEPSSFFPSSSPPRSEHRRAPSVPADNSYSKAFDSDSELNRSDSGSFFQRVRLDGSVRSLSTPIKKPGTALNTYASSMFQNSPSPEHLPPPSFSLASMKRGRSPQEI